jgi:hypothetical protein
MVQRCYSACVSVLLFSQGGFERFEKYYSRYFIMQRVRLSFVIILPISSWIAFLIDYFSFKRFDSSSIVAVF